MLTFCSHEAYFSEGVCKFEKHIFAFRIRLLLEFRENSIPSLLLTYNHHFVNGFFHHKRPNPISTSLSDNSCHLTTIGACRFECNPFQNDMLRFGILLLRKKINYSERNLVLHITSLAHVPSQIGHIFK